MANGVLCKGCGVRKGKLEMRVTFQGQVRCVTCCQNLEPRKLVLLK